MGRVRVFQRIANLVVRLSVALCAVMAPGMISAAASAQSNVDWDAAMASPSSSVVAYANRLLITTIDGRLLLCQTDARSCRQYTLPQKGLLSITGETVIARDALSSSRLDETSGEWLPITASTVADDAERPDVSLSARSQSRWRNGYGFLLPEYYSLWHSEERRWINLSLPNVPTRITAATPSWDGRCVWFLVGNQLAKIAVSSRKSAIFLPWNAVGISLKAIAAAPSGVWVATNFGTLLLNNAENHPVFVKASIDSPLDVRLPNTQERLVALVEKWQGTPYQYGAQQCQVSTDCSGFITGVYSELGVKLPRSSQSIGQWSGAQTVTDELQPADLLVSPGHVAMYMGNGLTVEASISRGVCWGTVFGRSAVTVKRILPRE